MIYQCSQINTDNHIDQTQVNTSVLPFAFTVPWRSWTVLEQTITSVISCMQGVLRTCVCCGNRSPCSCTNRPKAKHRGDPGGISLIARPTVAAYKASYVPVCTSADWSWHVSAALSSTRRFLGKQVGDSRRYISCASQVIYRNHFLDLPWNQFPNFHAITRLSMSIMRQLISCSYKMQTEQYNKHVQEIILIFKNMPICSNSPSGHSSVITSAFLSDTIQLNRRAVWSHCDWNNWTNMHWIWARIDDRGRTTLQWHPSKGKWNTVATCTPENTTVTDTLTHSVHAH